MYIFKNHARDQEKKRMSVACFLQDGWRIDFFYFYFFPNFWRPHLEGNSVVEHACVPCHSVYTFIHIFPNLRSASPYLYVCITQHSRPACSSLSSSESAKVCVLHTCVTVYKESSFARIERFRYQKHVYHNL